MTELLFWSTAFIIFYIYAGYPFLIVILSFFCRKGKVMDSYEPAVTILIAAHNEEQSIRATLENKLRLLYPKNKIEIIVISDGSTDNTDNIVRKYEKDSLKLIRQEPRNGKTSALNSAVPFAKGEILIFSDANSIYKPDAIQKLVKNFNNPHIGYITGKMIYINPDGSVIGDGCTAYMKYENILRRYESAVGSVVGVDGGIDAVRKKLYQPMRNDQLPDLVLPLTVVEQGYRVAYEPEAILEEQALQSSQSEYKMRVRVSLRALWALRDMKHLLNPFCYGLFSWQLFSHKVLRYAAFVFFIILYSTNVLLLPKGKIYLFWFIFQNLFYLFASLGRIFEKKGCNSKLFYIPYYFLLINIASGHAFLKFLKGEKQVMWNPRTG